MNPGVIDGAQVITRLRTALVVSLVQGSELGFTHAYQHPDVEGLATAIVLVTDPGCQTPLSSALLIAIGTVFAELKAGTCTPDGADDAFAGHLPPEVREMIY